MSVIEIRPLPAPAVDHLVASGLSPLAARLLAARGVADASELDLALANLMPFTQLKNAEAMAKRLADAIEAQQKLLIIGDYDADGATATAVGLRGLTLLGARVDFLVPNRFEYGYGLSPEIVDLAATMTPDILLTVDNGIASLDGVARAQSLGLEVLITDHHLPGDQIPDTLIVNPNQPGCNFPSKNLAGVGVMFYVLLALRAEARQRGWYTGKKESNLATLLDLVALGTVADVVKLDRNNRLLVHHGLERIRAGRLQPGLRALFSVVRKEPSRASSYDLGFMLGPRLNAAGRLDDMSIGIQCLITENEAQALHLAQTLDQFNRERREIEAGMQEEALAKLPDIGLEDRFSIALFDDSWHQGVIGIVASRLKEKFHRPVITFAPGDEGQIKGSGRSINGLHLRDALDLVSKRHPGLILKFGGHAMAAGLTLKEETFATFQAAFEQVSKELLNPNDLQHRWETDGTLALNEANLENAAWIEQQVWGQGFPAPSFHGRLRLMEQKILGEKHLRLTVAWGKQPLEAMLFFQAERLPDEIEAVFQLSVNHYMGNSRLQLIIQHWAPCPATV